MTSIAGSYDVNAALAAARTGSTTSAASTKTGGGQGASKPESSTVVTLSGNSGAKSGHVYGPMVKPDFFSFGDTSSLGSPSGPTRLEYNVYRPDGLAVAWTEPLTITATGEKMTEDVAKKYQDMLLDVTKDRIKIYQEGKSQGLSNTQIREKLQAFDEGLPDSYKALVGRSGMSDPATRYMLATRDESLGGPVQTE